MAIDGKGFTTGSSWATALCFQKGSIVQLPVMSQAFGSMEREVGETLVQLEVKGLSSVQAWLHDLQFWSVVSEKQLSISPNKIGSS